MHDTQTDDSDGFEAQPPDNEPPAGLRWARRALPIVFLLLMSVFAVREVRALDFNALRAALQAITLPKLLLLQSIAAIGILAMSLYDWHAARVLDLRIPLVRLLQNAWIANTFNNLVGLSGLAGSGLRMLLLGREKIDYRRGAAYSLLIMLSMPAGLALICAVVLFTGLPGEGSLPVPPWAASLALGSFAAYLPVYLVVLARGSLARYLPALPAQSATTLSAMVGISLLDWLLAALAVGVSLEISGAAVPWPQLLTAFAGASVLGILSMIPGGIGVFDTALVVLLAPVAHSPEQLVSGVLVYRLTYYLLPALLAVYLGSERLALPETRQRVALLRAWQESRFSVLWRLPLNLLAQTGVHLLAYMTFGAGVVLLASAAFPAASDRLAVLIRYLPLPAIEVSHLVSAIIGVLLVALSRGIAGQVRSAYHLAQVLLIGGALFTFFKGIDYEEASALLLVSLLLRRQRSRFHREAYPLLSVRSLRWLTGLVVAVIGFAWLGAWVHGSIPWTPEFLARFSVHHDAPRFARALLVAVTAAAAFVGWTFYARPRFVAEMPDTLALAEAESIMTSYGCGEFGHLLFLGDKSLLWSRDRSAFIQYGLIRDRLIALGDPCGNTDSFDDAIVGFRDFADRYGLTPCFYEAGENHLHRYHDAGFALFKLGENAIVELAEFTLSGKRGESLRHSVNRAGREGARFEMLQPPFDAALWAELHAVSDAWLAGVGTAEKGFSLGNYNPAYLARSAIAVIRADDRIVAFANLMPDYGSHAMLSVDLVRYRPEAPYGTMDFLFVEVMAYAKDQGYQSFNLGMAPLAGVGTSPYARTGEKVARLAFEYGNRFYNYKGLRSYKEKFHPSWRSTYLAYPILAPLPALLIDTAALIAGGYRRIFRKPD